MKRTIFFSLLVTCVLVYVLPCYSAQPLSPDPSAVETVQLEAEKGGYRLITIDELWALYQKNSDDLLLIDTRQEWEYASGYIEGALHFSMEPTWLARLTRRGPLEQFLGSEKTKTLVFY